MEKLVVDAVKGKPTVAPSKTSHFLIKNRAQTPGRWDQSDQSSSEAEYGSNADSRALTPTSAGDTGGSSFEGESDSATEMAFFSATLGVIPNLPNHPKKRTELPFHVLRPQTRPLAPAVRILLFWSFKSKHEGQRRRVPLDANSPTDREDLPVEGSQCEKSSSPRSGGPDPLSLGPLTLFITRIWSGAICARRTSRFGQRVPLKSCATTVQRGTCGVTSDGGTNTSRVWTPSAGRYGTGFEAEMERC